MDKIIENAVHTYINAFERNAIEDIMGIYAEECRVEDPVGSQPIIGKDAVRDFYTKSVDLVVKLELESQIRIVDQQAAFAFKVEIQMPTEKMYIYPIDIMVFNNSGKVISMQAYWGQYNTISN